MNKSLIGVAIMVVSLGVATCAALVKTKQEIDTSRAEIQSATKDPWVGNDSVKWVELAAEHNPSLWLPRPRDIAEKRDPVRPMREPIALAAADQSTVRFSYPAGLVDVMVDRTGDGSDPFIDRALAGFLRVSTAVPPQAR